MRRLTTTTNLIYGETADFCSFPNCVLKTYFVVKAEFIPSEPRLCLGMFFDGSLYQRPRTRSQ
jgi:hypothetical protein